MFYVLMRVVLSVAVQQVHGIQCVLCSDACRTERGRTASPRNSGCYIMTRNPQRILRGMRKSKHTKGTKGRSVKQQLSVEK